MSVPLTLAIAVSPGTVDSPQVGRLLDQVTVLGTARAGLVARQPAEDVMDIEIHALGHQAQAVVQA